MIFVQITILYIIMFSLAETKYFYMIKMQFEFLIFLMEKSMYLVFQHGMKRYLEMSPIHRLGISFSDLL